MGIGADDIEQFLDVSAEVMAANGLKYRREFDDLHLRRENE